MLERFRAHGLIWPTVASLAALSVLIGLGSWQLQRKVWKEDLLAQMSARLTAPVSSVADVDAAMAGGASVEYSRVRLSGTFEHDKERYYYAPDKRLGPGFHVYTPLKLDGGAARYVWVNRGYVTSQFRLPATRQAGQADGSVEVSGVVRRSGRQGAFAPENDVDGNLWYWRDLSGMHASAFADAAVEHLPYFVEAEKDNAAVKDGRPRGGATSVKLPNRHLEYAVTWFGLACTLIGVYVAFVFARLRQPAGSRSNP